MRLGQHFLINKKKIQQIIDALELKSGDTVIEIGPGNGELTDPLVNRLLDFRDKIIIIEKDHKFVEGLQEKFAQNKNIKIIEGDALKIIPELAKSYNLKDKNYKLVGNIPYYITGYLLRIIGELKYKPSLIVLTIQKEVAERICALRQVQGKPQMNLLAASVQFWAKPEIIGYVPKKDFQPAPKVDGAIIKLTTNNQLLITKEENKYYKFIKILFKQPRKTILNNLINAGRFDLPKIDVNIRRPDLQKLLQKIGISPNDRPQNLTVKQIIKLSSSLSNMSEVRPQS